PPLLKELAALSLLAAGIRWPDTPDAKSVPITGDDALSWTIGKDIVASAPDRVIFWARVPFILIAAGLGVLLYVCASQLMGETAALCALFLYVMNPNVLGHSYLVTMDCGFGAFTVLFLYALWNHLRKPGWFWLVLTGVSMGLAMCAKFSGIALPPLAG